MLSLLESSADGDFGKKSVTALQKFLNQEGFYCGAEDGDWGGSTEKALQLFSSSRKEFGMVGRTRSFSSNFCRMRSRTARWMALGARSLPWLSKIS